MSETTPKNFELKFTGKVSVIIDIEGYSPMSININDKELASDLVKFLLDNMNDDDSNFGASTKEMDERYIKIIEEIE